MGESHTCSINRKMLDLEYTQNDSCALHSTTSKADTRRSRDTQLGSITIATATPRARTSHDKSQDKTLCLEGTFEVFLHWQRYMS